MTLTFEYQILFFLNVIQYDSYYSRLLLIIRVYIYVLILTDLLQLPVHNVFFRVGQLSLAGVLSSGRGSPLRVLLQSGI